MTYAIYKGTTYAGTCYERKGGWWVWFRPLRKGSERLKTRGDIADYVNAIFHRVAGDVRFISINDDLLDSPKDPLT